MEIESDRTNFAVTDNVLSDALLLLDNYCLVDYMKSIFVILSQVNFNLAMGALLKSLKSVIGTNSFPQYAEILGLMKCGATPNGYLSLAE